MSEDYKPRKERNAEDLKEVLSIVSDKIPQLIKGLIQSIFSEDAAAGMGRAAAAYYKELKAGGIPDDVAVRMTEDYVGMFTKISEFLRTATRGQGRHGELGDEIKELVHERIRERMKEKAHKDEE